MRINDVLIPSIIDIEASGFGNTSYPIEVGVVTGCGRRYCSLIKPYKGWQHWCTDAENMHGITKQELCAYGKSIFEICKELNDLLRATDVFSDALSHDARWLNKLFSQAGVRRDFNIRAIEHIMLETQFERWDDAKQKNVNTSKNRRHRASSDAWLIQRTFVETRQNTCIDNHFAAELGS